MLLKGGLHVHTNCSDGRLSPQEAADVYGEKGFDFIAFTDHDYLLRPGAKGFYERVKSDLILFAGVEMTVFAKGYVHVSRVQGEKEVLHILNHLGDYHLSLEQMLERVRTGAEMFPLDAVEITSNGFRCPEWEIPEIPYPKLAADDSHGREGIGRAWIELDAQRDKDDILRAIKRGEFWNCYR